MRKRQHIPKLTPRDLVVFVFLCLIFYGDAASAASIAQNVTFYAGNPNQQTSSFLVNPNSQVADGNQAVAGVIVVRDVFGNLVSNQNVVFTTPSSTTISCIATSPTNSSGQASVSCTSTKAQNTTLQASLPSFWSQNANITFTPGDPNLTTTVLTSNSPAVANNTNSITATLILRDAFSNAIPGQTITFSTNASNATFSPTSAITDANGMATAQFYSTQTQTASATAQFSSTSLNTPLVFVPGPASATYSSLVLDTNSQVTNSNITYSIHLADAYNNPIPNQNVVLSVSGIGAQIAGLIATTHSDANFQSTITSPYVGANTLRATANSMTLSAPMTFSASSSGCGGNPNYIYSTIDVGAPLRYFDVGDINHDGYADIVFSYSNISAVAIVYGQGGGAFSAPVNYTQVASPNNANATISLNVNTGITVRDIDKDGYDDIIIASSTSSGYVSILFGGTSNPLTTSYSFNTNSKSPINSAVGDINNDGYLDVVLSDYGDANIAVMFGRQTHDANALVFGYTKSATVSTLWSSTVADVDDDGFLDVLTSTNHGGSSAPILNIFWGTSSGVLSSPTAYTTANCAQMNGVGHFSSASYLDVLALATCDANILVFPGQGTKTLGSPWAQHTGSGYVQAFALQDLNGDGVLDLISTNASDKTLKTYMGSIGSSNNLTASKVLSVGYAPTLVKVWDINQDGYQDIVVSASNTNNITLFTFANCN